LGGFGFPVFEQDGNFSKTHFVIQKIFGMQPFALTKPVFAHVKLFTHAISGLNVSKQRHEALSAQKCRVCWPCAEHPRKQVRKWKRACQLRLIEERNPGWIPACAGMTDAFRFM